MIISESLFRLQAEEKLDLRKVKIMESSVTITIEKNSSVPFMTFRLINRKWRECLNKSS